MAQLLPRARKLQVLRRSVQLLVVALVVLTPTLARYNNYLSARELDRMIERWQGTLPGSALAAIDSGIRILPGAERERVGKMQRHRDSALAYTQKLRGGAWSAEVAGVSITDPLAATESVVASRRVPWVLVIGVTLPIIASLMLGRVFCSWVCPMGLLLECSDKLRRLLRLLELPPRNFRASRGIKYGLLATGLLLTTALSTPILGYVYPPAVLGRELHDLVFGVFDRAELGRFGFWAGSLSWPALFLLSIVAIEATISRRWWCRYVCPGGALYSLIGAARPVRVKLTQQNCTGCARCVSECPMGLNPMKNQMGLECDSCGVCISACNDKALSYGIQGPRVKHVGSGLAAGIALLLLGPSAADAHHILGIPHYAYDEQYPQTPVLTYRVDAGAHEVKMTGYPGVPTPGERCSLHVYISHRDTGAPFKGRVTLSVKEDRLIGSDPVVYGPVAAELEEAVYKFFPEFEAEANYVARIAFEADGGPWTIDLPIVVGEPGSPWLVLGSVVIGTIVFLVVIRALRIKKQRRIRAASLAPSVATRQATTDRGWRPSSPRETAHP